MSFNRYTIENGWWPITGDFDHDVLPAIARGDFERVEWYRKYYPDEFQSFESVCKKKPPTNLIFGSNVKNRRKNLIKFIEDGMDVHFLNHNGENLLHQLIDSMSEKTKYDAAPIADVLIEHGVPVNQVDVFGFSPLHHSIKKYNILMGSYLINKGADVSLKSKRKGLFPLLMATQFGNFDFVKLLISSGADVNDTNHYGFTALHAACNNNREKIIDLLVRSGADATVVNEEGSTPFSLLNADKKDYFECIKLVSSLKFEGFTIPKKDIDSFLEKPSVGKFFTSLMDELDKMASNKFYPPYSLYSVLKMSTDITKLATLTKNKEFVEKFQESSSYIYYVTGCHMVDARKNFNQAIKIRDEFETVHSRLYSIFKDSLPDLVLRKLAGNLTVKNLPLDHFERLGILRQTDT